jgi:hypothetical protein
MNNTTPGMNPATPPPPVLTLQYLLSVPSVSQFAPGLTSENGGRQAPQAPLLLSPGNIHRKILSRQELGGILRSALAIIEDRPDVSGSP